jgi:hypothetical protein
MIWGQQNGQIKGMRMNKEGRRQRNRGSKYRGERTVYHEEEGGRKGRVMKMG